MRTRSFVALLPLVLAVGCSDDPTQPATPTGDMEIALSHVVTDPTTRGVQDLVLGSDMLRYETPFGNMFSVDNLHYFISNVTLHSPEGDVSFDLIHYVDASDHDTHTIHLHDVPPRHVHEVSFTFGLDDDDNVAGAVPSSLDHMSWPQNWGGGYHYMKLEGKTLTGTGIQTSFLTHVGRFVENDGAGPSHAHFFEITAATHTDLNAGETRIANVAFDVNGWFRTPNEIDLLDHAGGIMTNTAMQNLLEENGPNVFTLTGVTDEDGHEHGDEG